MAAPHIGTTVSEGYGRGFDRLGDHAGAALAPALAIGLVSGVIALGQAQLVPNPQEVVQRALEGKETGLSQAVHAGWNLLWIASFALQLLVTFLGAVVFAGTWHRARHGEPVDLPGPAAMPGALSVALARVMPRVAVLVGLPVGGLLAATLIPRLGGLIAMMALVAFLVYSIRWIYAPVVAGSGEAVRSGAFARSELAVAGSWWGTLGVWMVIGIAIGLPTFVVGLIVDALLPGVFLSAAGPVTVSMLASFTIGASALESAWWQLEQREVVPPPDAAGHPDHEQLDEDAHEGPFR